MKPIITALALILIVSGGIQAQCLPDPGFSICSLNIIDNDPCPTISPPTVIWCPTGDLSRFEVYIQLRDASNAPCTFTDARIVVNLRSQPSVPGNTIFACGFDSFGYRDWSVTTDANGEATIEFWGGGCGCLGVDYQVFSSGAVTCFGTGTFCVKSPDMNGDGTVNFFDSFQYIPCLMSTVGYCCDFNCSGNVDFFDTFVYLPHLLGGHNCLGNTVPIGTPCGLTCN